MSIKRFISALLLLTILLGGCIPAEQETPQPVPTEPETPSNPEADWWRDAVIYEIFVRSFYDTNGDGVGDFNGITKKLDYLESLGINTIWLMPINPSPVYHGYHVTNYFAVNPDYGTMNDFIHLLDEAHKRDIHIIIDLVLNHTSTLHPYFVEANSSPDSKYRDWYIWSDTTHGNKWHEGNEGYYFGYFSGEIPDLNYRNPDVTAQMYKVTKYWLEDVGVNGFRLDAAKHLIEEGDKYENTQSTHDWFREYYSVQKSAHPDAYMIGEIYGAGAFIATTYEGQFDQIFNFELASGIVNSANGNSNTGINSAWKFTLKDMDNGDYATFLTNHDQNRAMSVFKGSENKAKLASFMLLTAPGTPFIYYGEEIGMQGQKPDEDIRLPMQWNNEANAGFTTGNPWRDPNPDFAEINVAAQEQNTDSLLNHYRALIQLREEYPALRTGKTYLLETSNNGVYAIIRNDENQNFLILANLKKDIISEYGLELKDSILPDKTFTSHAVFGSGDDAHITISGGKFSDYKPIDELPPYSMYVFQFK